MKSIFITALTLLLLSTSVYAGEIVKGGVTFEDDYAFHGLPMSDTPNKISENVGIELYTPWHFYLGL